MLINTASLTSRFQPQGAAVGYVALPSYLNNHGAGYSADAYYLFCDICGHHASINLDVPIHDERNLDRNHLLPDGWVPARTAHICPDCASAMPDELRYAVSRKDSREASADALSADAASHLKPDENGVLVIPDGVRTISYKAFMYRDDFTSIRLPHTLEHIGEFAFSYSTLRTIELPQNVRTVGEKAFYHCTELKHVQLSDALVDIGSEAFTACSIESLLLPASLAHIGRNAFAGTSLVMSGPDQTLCIDRENPYLSLDQAGGLYVKIEDEVVFTALLASGVKRYEIMEGTHVIGPYACQSNKTLQHVIIPEGVTRIERDAFCGCMSLEHVELPSTLCAIGQNVFYDTALRELELPVSLTYIGPSALATGSIEYTSALKHVAVDPNCKRFFARNDLLCVNKRDGSCGVLLSISREREIVLPANTSSISSHAFCDLSPGSRIRVPRTLSSIHPNALSEKFKATFVFELDHEECGLTTAHMKNPPRSALVESALGGFIDLAELFSACDYLMSASHNVYHQVCYVLGRLSCPQFLSDEMRAKHTAQIQRIAVAAVRELAVRGDTQRIERMAQLELLTASSISMAIDNVADLNDAAVNGCLLDIKHRLFADDRKDFSL